MIYRLQRLAYENRGTDISPRLIYEKVHNNSKDIHIYYYMCARAQLAIRITIIHNGCESKIQFRECIKCGHTLTSPVRVCVRVWIFFASARNATG